MRNSFVHGLVIALSAAFVCSAGLAQEKRSAEDLSRLEEEAWKAADAGDIQKAIDIWEGIMPEITGEGRIVIHKNLAAGYGMLKNLPASWYHLTIYLEKIGKEDVKAARRLEKLEKAMMETHRKVFIACDPSGATLHFGIEATGPAYSCPVTWWFEPGKQFVYAEKNGYRAQTAQYDVRRRGEKGVWTVKLVELPKYGHLVVKGEGKAIQVFLDGSLEGTVPFKRKLKEGTYELMVGKPGEMPWKKTVVVKADATTVEEPPNARPEVAGEVDQGPGEGGQIPVVADQVSTTGRSKVGPVVLLGGGVGLVVVGAILNGIGHGKEQDVYDRYAPTAWDNSMPREEYNQGVANAQDNYKAAYADEVQPFKTWTYVLYGVGGATAVAGAVWLVLKTTSEPEKKTDIVVSPLMGPGTVGALFGMEF